MTGAKVSSFTERFGELVGDLMANGAQRVDIAKQLGVSKQTISAWETGERSPKRPTVAGIAQTYDINIAWLHGFDAPKKRQAPAATADERKSEFVELFSKLSDEQQEVFIQAMKGVVGNK